MSATVHVDVLCVCVYGGGSAPLLIGCERCHRLTPRPALHPMHVQRPPMHVVDALVQVVPVDSLMLAPPVPHGRCTCAHIACTCTCTRLGSDIP